MNETKITQKRRLVAILHSGSIVIILAASLFLLDQLSATAWVWILVGGYSSTVSLLSFLKIVRRRRWVRAGLMVLVFVVSLAVVAAGAFVLYFDANPGSMMPMPVFP